MRFKDFINESEYTLSKYTSKQVGEFVDAMLNQSRKFEWIITDRDYEESIGWGQGDFQTCIKKIESKIMHYKDSDYVGIVGLEGENIQSSLTVMYDPKKKKWGLA